MRCLYNKGGKHMKALNYHMSSGGTRGGVEGDIAPHVNMLAPCWKVKRYFLDIFGIYNTLTTIL